MRGVCSLQWSARWLGGWLIGLLLAGEVLAQAYSLGIGDEVRISVYGQPDLAIDAQIGADGAVEVPLLGRFNLAGRSTTDAAQAIADQYERGNFLKRAQVNLLVTRYRSQSIAILGRVKRAGSLVLEGPTSLTDALAWAGGIADEGSERLVLIRTDRSGKQERREFDLQKLLNQEAERHSVIWLQDGDTLYVPPAGRFYLSGEVRSPGVYTLDRPLNVMQALGMGGGLTARASERSVKLYRPQTDGSLKERRAKAQDPVEDGDLLVVQESLF
ncbi:SLBB domain-containing protein [Cellvibrio japonicus]|uniref:EpsE n=1 Tax=Cellvibrio japonicus (strain Ueda107) TaxID=498211 RepID=B3PJL8_CELJU|nr:polysaccharide biosynthesis/export family protein [Cellvibrio japonicus]ACE85849.1 EpsE [Cellvibrio japonicus Ueda107]QEI11302.1 polysaccharide export protein EpsE [Cellvibrio japonicus]QEI14876.1 polysaccharide export protein EpsE [Cellvibrio japonicus]QEI18456.1 polysaccharide export protein EpsE [Cellvibrio japonicus]